MIKLGEIVYCVYFYEDIDDGDGHTDRMTESIEVFEKREDAEAYREKIESDFTVSNVMEARIR